MTELFSTTLRLGLAGSYAIVLVFIVRLFLRKAPKIFSYALWAVVFFRLICPYSFHADFSIVPESITYPERIEIENVQSSVSEELLNPVVTDDIAADFIDKTIDVIPNNSSYFSLMNIASTLWIFGVIVLWGYSITSLLTLKHKLKSACQLQENIYESEMITTPFVLGLLKPHIYLPHQIQQDELNYILMHERIHIQRKDYIIKPFAFMIVCLHWFNPLVWAAWFSMSKDMEMSCDEAVIRKMGSFIKKEYSTSLLNMASQKNLLNASPLAFSDHNAKNRIMNVLSYKKPAFWMITLIAVLLTSLSLGLFTNKYKSPELKTALENLAPYLRVEPEDVEVLSEISKKELTIYKLAQGDTSIGNTFFLIFRNGILEDTYFNMPTDREPEFYNVGAADQIAIKYVKDVYQMDVTFDQHLHTGNLYNYGNSSKTIGTVVHFAAKIDDQVVNVTVSTANGDIIASSSHQLWKKTWKTASSEEYDDNYSLLITEDYLILAEANLAINIYPITLAGKQIECDDYTLYDNQKPFTLTINDKKVNFSPLSSQLDGIFYSQNLQTRTHADHNTIKELSWYISRILGSYRISKNQDSFIHAKQALFSSYSAALNSSQKVHWDKQLHTQLNI